MYPSDTNHDAWHWLAVYHDGTQWPEYDPDTEEQRGIASIDFSQLSYLQLIPQHSGLPNHILTLPAGARPIFFRRHPVDVLFDAGSGEITELNLAYRPITCLGWQRTVEGHNVASFTFLLENGSVIVTDDRDALYFGVNNEPSLRLPVQPAPEAGKGP